MKNPATNAKLHQISRDRDNAYIALMRRTNGKATPAQRWESDRPYRDAIQNVNDCTPSGQEPGFHNG